MAAKSHSRAGHVARSVTQPDGVIDVIGWSSRTWDPGRRLGVAPKYSATTTRHTGQGRELTGCSD